MGLDVKRKKLLDLIGLGFVAVAFTGLLIATGVSLFTEGNTVVEFPESSVWRYPSSVFTKSLFFMVVLVDGLLWWALVFLARQGQKK